MEAVSKTGRIAERLRGVAPSATLEVTRLARELSAQGKPVVNWAAGEPDSDSPDFVKQAVVKALAEGFTKYTPTTGTPDLKKAVCQSLLQTKNLHYDPAQIIVSCGAKHSIFNLFMAVLNPGDEVIIPSPYWVSYPEMARVAGAVPVLLETREADGFKIEPAALREAVTPRTKLIVLNSPANPTGAVLSRKELEALADAAGQSRALWLSDEIYDRIVYDGGAAPSIAQLSDELKARTLIVNGVSKSYAMTGFRIGYAAIPDKGIAEAVSNLQDHSTSNPASTSQRAAAAALTGNQDCVEKLRQEFQARRDLLHAGLSKIRGLSAPKPGGAFYVFCNVSRTGLSGKEFCRKLLEEQHVAAIPGEAFGWPTHARFSFACSRDSVAEGLGRLEKFMGGLGRHGGA